MKRVTFDEIDAVECRIKSAFLKEEESERNQKGAKKRSRKNGGMRIFFCMTGGLWMGRELCIMGK